MRKVLKYPGSKWNISDQLVKMIPDHHSYLEPYFGSGAMLFSKIPSAIETINDIDSNVVNLFHCIQKDSEKLARIVLTIPYSREVYDAIFSGKGQIQDEFEKAAYFLTRCWQSHGFRANFSKVGWKSDIQGRESMYALWDWYRLPQWIPKMI